MESKFRDNPEKIETKRETQCFQTRQRVDRNTRVQRATLVDLFEQNLALIGAAKEVLQRSNKGEGIFSIWFQKQNFATKYWGQIVGVPKTVFKRYKEVVVFLTRQQFSLLHFPAFHQ